MCLCWCTKVGASCVAAERHSGERCVPATPSHCWPLQQPASLPCNPAVPRQDSFTGAMMVIWFAHLGKALAMARLCWSATVDAQWAEFCRSLQLLTNAVLRVQVSLPATSGACITRRSSATCELVCRCTVLMATGSGAVPACLLLQRQMVVMARLPLITSMSAPKSWLQVRGQLLPAQGKLTTREEGWQATTE